MSENITYCQHGVYAIAVWVLTQTAIAFQKGILYTESKSLKIRYCSYTGPLAPIRKMRILTFILIILISSCGQPDNSGGNKEAEPVISTNLEKHVDSSYSEENEEIESSFPDWLIENYPTELEFEYGYTLKQEIKDYRIVNDSISYCIYQQMDGVCSRRILDTYTKQIKTDSLEIAENCDHDLSLPTYSWKEFEVKSSNIILTTEFIESVHDSLIDENGMMKKGYDFMEAETTVDTIKQVFQVNNQGLIKEIKK